MGDESDGGRRKRRVASCLYTCSEGATKLSDVMKVAGYTTPDRKGGAMYQRVCRAAMNILKEIQQEADVPLIVVLGNVMCTNDLSLLSNAVTFNMRRSNASLSSISIEQASTALSIRRRLAEDLATIDPKKRRRRSK